MLTLSDSKTTSENYQSRKRHRKQKILSRLIESDHSDGDFSTEERKEESEIQIDYHTEFKPDPDSIVHLNIDGEIISCDTNFSNSPDQMIKNEETEDSKVVDAEEDPLFIKEEPLQVYFLEQDTNNDWLNSITIYSNYNEETFSKCPCCSALFYEENKLKSHLLSHSHIERNKIVCAFCNFSTDKFDAFTAHLHAHQDQCEVCNQNLSKRKILDKHMTEAKFNYHTKRDQYNNFVCTICQNLFGLKHHLEKHWFKHSCEENKIYQCNACSAVFITLEYLENHKCLQCPICNKIYSSFPNLRSHTRYERHFLYCSVCSYEFSLRVDHERHMELHNKTFQTHDKFLYCLQAVDKSTLQCKLCGKLVQTDSSFVAHVFREHNVNVTLDLGSDDDVIEIVNPRVF